MQPIIALLYLVLALVCHTGSVVAELNWVNCTYNSPRSLRGSTNAETLVSSLEDFVVKCMSVQVPLKWNDPSEQRQINFFVKRVLSKVPSKRIGQLWLFTGGPGGNGATFEPYVKTMMEVLDDRYDIYMPDQRGTGRSSRLECTAENGGFFYNADDLEACLQQSLNSPLGSNGGLQGYTTTNSAKDVKFVMDQIPGTRVIYGVSYGTFLLNRYLTLYGNSGVDIAIADAVVTPGAFVFDRTEDYVNMAGERFMTECQTDTFCSNLFKSSQQGFTVRNAFRKAFARQSGGNKCVPDMTPTRLKFLCGFTVGQFIWNKLIIPTIFRINRCNNDDKDFLNNFLMPIAASLEVAQPKVTKPVGRSIADDPAGPNIVRELWRNIVSSEMSTLPRSLMVSIEDGIEQFNRIPSYFGQNGTANMVNNILSRGNNLYPDPYRLLLGSGYTKPMLSLHGTFDSIVAYDTTLRWRLTYNKPGQFFQTYKGMVHGIFGNAYNLENGALVNCGWRIMADFILDPTRPPTPECASRIIDSPYDFSTAIPPLTTMLANANQTLYGI